MTKLDIVVQYWNKEKILFYKPVINILKENNINKVEELLQIDIQLLCNMTKMTKQIVKAFKQDIMYSVPIEEEIFNSREKKLYQYPITTGFKDLDTCTNQIIELCGTTNNRGKSNFISSVLSSFIRDYSKEDIYVYDTSGIFFERMMSDNSHLNNIACTQLVDLAHFLSAMDNVSTLLSIHHERPSLVLIDDISNLIMNWNQNIEHVVNTFKSMSRLNCIIILLHNHHTNFTLKKYELDWNPMIDTRLLFTIQNGDDKVEIIKSRQRVIQLTKIRQTCY